MFAHRTTKPGLFRNLHKLKKGDSITAGGITYKVRFIEIVSVNDKDRIWRYDGAGARISLVGVLEEERSTDFDQLPDLRPCERLTATGC